MNDKEKQEEKSEEERIREILKSKVYTFGEANILGCRGAAEAIYKEIIEPLKRENYVLKQENRGMQTETNALQESINRAGNVISALQTRIQELEAEKDELKAEMQQWIEASQGL